MIQFDLLYSARAFLNFIESAHFILYILVMHILVVTCSLFSECLTDLFIITINQCLCLIIVSYSRSKFNATAKI